ncbi:VOC family protein [Cellulomonas wangsupingiae]|uniref:VOC family protein n=1 Tax=Cellulomonas wangsupingiae TaxID=2968085 RepID=A0ABY5K647_9CELL|nr:VOC family protein [Cellulomonas wangsupingiae]MCC2335034.1 VOC family protein [Cellulomonas wangsupingiae]UUI65533.1 VOC family protein [Cellulomonas wangsupingiae]
MPSRLTALNVDVHDPARAGGFWAALLGREVRTGADGVLVPGSGTQLGLRFTATDEPKVGRDRMHLHLNSTDAADQRRTVAKALRLGARHLDVGQLPEEQHVVLADPEGGELCVIEPGTTFLAGCGFLAELTCEGSRDVGFFWAAALGWPLVWDEGPQTAVQSPRGGTKVSWDGPPSPRRGRERQRFDLTVAGGDLADEVARLTAIGATPLGPRPDGTTGLADPDGNVFLLRAVG